MRTLQQPQDYKKRKYRLDDDNVYSAMMVLGLKFIVGIFLLLLLLLCCRRSFSVNISLNGCGTTKSSGRIRENDELTFERMMVL